MTITITGIDETLLINLLKNLNEELESKRLSRENEKKWIEKNHKNSEIEYQVVRHCKTPDYGVGDF